MTPERLSGRLDFLREAEKLKDVLRSAHTSSGRQESTAEPGRSGLSRGSGCAVFALCGVEQA